MYVRPSVRPNIYFITYFSTPTPCNIVAVDVGVVVAVTVALSYNIKQDDLVCMSAIFIEFFHKALQ